MYASHCLHNKETLNCEDYGPRAFTEFMALKMNNAVWYTLLQDLDTLEQGGFHIFHRSQASLKGAEFK